MQIHLSTHSSIDTHACVCSQRVLIRIQTFSFPLSTPSFSLLSLFSRRLGSLSFEWNVLGGTLTDDLLVITHQFLCYSAPRPCLIFNVSSLLNVSLIHELQHKKTTKHNTARNHFLTQQLLDGCLEFCIDIHHPQMISPDNCGDLLTFHVVLSSD